MCDLFRGFFYHVHCTGIRCKIWNIETKIERFFSNLDLIIKKKNPPNSLDFLIACIWKEQLRTNYFNFNCKRDCCIFQTLCSSIVLTSENVLILLWTLWRKSYCHVKMTLDWMLQRWSVNCVLSITYIEILKRVPEFSEMRCH